MMKRLERFAFQGWKNTSKLEHARERLQKSQVACRFGLCLQEIQMELANKKLILANAVEDLHLQENVQMQG